jgi:cell division protein FtsQ
VARSHLNSCAAREIAVTQAENLPLTETRAYFAGVSVGISQRVRRPSRPSSNRKRRAALLARLPRPSQLAGRAAAGLRKNLGAVVALVVVAAVSAGAFAAYRWVNSSPRFAVASIEVRGNRRLAAAPIADRLAAARGHNVFRLDLGALAAQVELEPHVARARVHRELPATLVVEIVEHVPAAVVELDGLYLADGKGRLFARASTERDDVTGLPIITGLDRAATARDPEAAAARVVAVLAVAAAWKAGGRPPLGELHLDDDRGTTLYLLDPAIAIHLGAGSGDELARRLAAFDAAWTALDAAERARTASIHLGRGLSPARVTVAFAELN